MRHVLAIHPRPESFSDAWVSRALKLGHDVRQVDCLSSDVISHLSGCEALLWHWTHIAPADLLVARSVIAAAETAGLLVFPSSASCWHFDDKLGQKYVLEAIGAPIAPTYVSFDRPEAEAWARAATYPKVFKLRRGAGATNVRLVRTPSEALRIVRHAFGAGIPTVAGYTRDAAARIKRAQRTGSVLAKLRRAPMVLRNVMELRRAFGRERGYVLFQDFLPGNTFDTRVTVIGRRAFAFTRNTRENDFRASGSGSIDYDRARIDERCVRIAFAVTRRLGAQSLAFDFAFDSTRAPRILEISYAYQPKAVFDCPGHWDDHLAWHEGRLWPQDAILDDVLAALVQRQDPKST